MSTCQGNESTSQGDKNSCQGDEKTRQEEEKSGHGYEERVKKIRKAKDIRKGPKR